MENLYLFASILVRIRIHKSRVVYRSNLQVIRSCVIRRQSRFTMIEQRARRQRQQIQNLIHSFEFQLLIIVIIIFSLFADVGFGFKWGIFRLFLLKGKVLRFRLIGLFAWLLFFRCGIYQTMYLCFFFYFVKTYLI